MIQPDKGAPMMLAVGDAVENSLTTLKQAAKRQQSSRKNHDEAAVCG
jgi:hypothetical protein